MEKETYTAYDLEAEPAINPEKKITEKNPTEKESEKVEAESEEVSPETEPEETDVPKELTEQDPARKEIEAMMDEMGAEKVLEIIRDNRNAAIRQIMTEMEEQSDTSLQSGTSVGNQTRSIFDLASLA